MDPDAVITIATFAGRLADAATELASGLRQEALDAPRATGAYLDSSPSPGLERAAQAATALAMLARSARDDIIDAYLLGRQVAPARQAPTPYRHTPREPHHGLR